MALSGSITSSSFAKQLQEEKKKASKQKRVIQKQRAHGHVSVDELYRDFLAHNDYGPLLKQAYRSQSALQSALKASSIGRSGSTANAGESVPKASLYGEGKGQTQVFKTAYYDKLPAEQFILEALEAQHSANKKKQEAKEKSQLSNTSPEPIQVLRNLLFGRYQLPFNELNKGLKTDPKKYSIVFEEGKTRVNDSGVTVGQIISVKRPKRTAKQEKASKVKAATDTEFVAINNLYHLIVAYQDSLKAKKDKTKQITDKDKRISQYSKDWKTFVSTVSEGPQWKPGLEALTRKDKELIASLNGDYNPALFSKLAETVRRVWKK